MGLKEAIQNIWASDYVQKNPNKAYKVSYADEYTAVAAFINGGPEPDWSGFSKLGQGLCGAEKHRRAEVGPTGPTGATGPGPTGATGPTGVTGATGPSVPSAPITITQGGTYSGHWRSTSSTPAVRISTAQPVIIENSIVESTATGVNDHLLSQSGSAANLIIRRTKFIGPNAFPGAGYGRAIRCENFKSVRVENCDILRTGGIYFLIPAAAPSIYVGKNKMRNIQGDAGGGKRQFLQCNGIQGGTVLAEWNEILNTFGESVSEDVFSIFNTSNATLRNNYIHGCYPVSLTGGHQGTGILLADVQGSNNLAHDNQVISGVNGGIGAFGTNNVVRNNRIISDGRNPAGQLFSAANVGLICYQFGNYPAPSNVRFYDNYIGWMRYNGGNPSRNDNYTPLAANNVVADNEWVGGTHNGRAVTKADEDAEWAFWLAKVAAAGVTIGV
jgi:hypothetical protein